MEDFDEVGDGQKAAASRVQLSHHPRTVLLVPQSSKHPRRDALKEVVVLWRGTLEKDTLRLALFPGHELVRAHNISHVSARAPHAWARHAVQSIDDGVGVCGQSRRSLRRLRFEYLVEASGLTIVIPAQAGIQCSTHPPVDIPSPLFRWSFSSPGKALPIRHVP